MQVALRRCLLVDSDIAVAADSDGASPLNVSLCVLSRSPLAWVWPPPGVPEKKGIMVKIINQHSQMLTLCKW